MDYLAHLGTDSDRFLTAVTAADPSSPVPPCPDWTAADLLWHLGQVQWFWGSIVGERLQSEQEGEARNPPRPRSQQELVAFFEASTARLRTELAATDPGEPVWTWADDDRTVGFVLRRQAHEALIHRLDAELTVGDVTALDPELAADGVDEVLTRFLGGVPRWGRFDSAGVFIAIEATDTPLVVPLELGRWSGTSPNTGNTYDEPIFEVVDPAHAAIGTVVTGSAGDLDAWLWGRRDAASLTVSGDPEGFRLLARIVAEGIQ